MKLIAALLACALALAGQTLPGTQRLEYTGNPVEQMIGGMAAHLERLTAESSATRKPSAERLRFILGVVDPRVPFQEFDSTVLRAETPQYRVYSVRWPVLDGVWAEGLHFVPKSAIRMRVVALADAGEPPENLQRARELAAAGCEVLAPVLIDLQSTWSANPAIGKKTAQTHREWIYRMAFPVGRHIYGYEVQKTLAAVDWFTAQQPKVPVAIFGSGEGGAVATFAAAMDARIEAVEAPGFSLEQTPLWKQPLYRNVFGLLRDFGDAEFRTMLGARARTLPAAQSAALELSPPQGRMQRQVREMVEFTQKLVRQSDTWRDALWKQAGPSGVATKFVNEVIGVLPGQSAPPNVRSRFYLDAPKWQAWEVRLDVRPGIFAQGFLLLPKDLKPGERRPLVVVQHGLNGRAEVLFAEKAGRNLDIYRNFGAQLADLGYIVFSPQSPYVDEFRYLVRLANPLGLSLYSLIRAQYQTMLDWLETMPQVDAQRIGFYGLSYGGKTALRVPPFDERFKVAICAGDFNEWIRKLTSVDAPYSYMFTHEYELPEWNMAAVANHAELAMIMAPRAFMVERGHRDGVGVDEWVSYEYARVRRYYDEAGWADRTSIAFFNGPHRVDGPAALAFLRKFLEK
jgi:cephalosporin-C deacetylase-like acetyl esterase